MELGLARVHPEIVKMLGRLKFRYSYAQNVLRHSVECGFIAGLMAAELGLNVRKARRAGLLHDLGKATSHEQEGSHALVGAQFARKHGEEPIIVNAIASHHEEEAPTSVIAHLVAAADALSGARPGARREMLESYIKRLESLENICHSFSGVGKSYAFRPVARCGSWWSTTRSMMRKRWCSPGISPSVSRTSSPIPDKSRLRLFARRAPWRRRSSRGAYFHPDGGRCGGETRPHCCQEAVAQGDCRVQSRFHRGQWGECGGRYRITPDNAKDLMQWGVTCVTTGTMCGGSGRFAITSLAKDPAPPP